jgi:Na+-driven multidrug efflux pump
MTFATAKFRSFLPAATFAMAAEFLMGLSDLVICGHIIGETGLSAINLMQGVFEVVTFVGMMVAVGTSVLFATELGALHVRRARGYFTLGFMAAIAFGLLVAAVLAAVRMPVIAAFGASQEVSAMAASYWLWFLPASVLEPVAFFLGTLCYTDGDARLSFCSYMAQLFGNCLMSVPLTMAFGASGCAVGTGLGSLLAIVVLLFHFRKKGCMLGFSRHFALSDLMRISSTSLGDASKNIGKAALMFALNAYVIARFGSDTLPVLAVVLMTIGISEVFDGVANAAQPLASVYIGERNALLTKRVMRTAFMAALMEGGGAMLLLLACPGLMLFLAGVKAPATVPEAMLAVRMAAISLPGLALVLLFNSYYVFIGREGLSTTLTLCAVLVAPLALFLPFGSLWGAHGVWLAIGLAPGTALGIVALYVLARGGARGFPFLLSGSREAALSVFDLELEPDAVCATSAAVEAHLRKHGVDDRRASKAALLVEEALMVVRDKNAGRRIKAEVTVDLNDGLTLVLRDDGEIFDITDTDARISSLRSYLVSNLMTAIPSRRNLTTTGFNRNVFKL